MLNIGLFRDAKFDNNKDFDSSDPSAGIMNLMKKMYDDGDDDMKRMIKKTWYESQQKQAAGGGIPGVWRTPKLREAKVLYNSN